MAGGSWQSIPNPGCTPITDRVKNHDAPVRFVRHVVLGAGAQRDAGHDLQAERDLGRVSERLILVKPGATDTLSLPWISAPGTYRVGINYTSDSTSIAGAQVSFSNGFAVAK
jgi:hypothetical protein